MIESKTQFATRRRCRARGFTLIEASLTMVIVGVGFLAMLQLLAAGTMTNIRAVETTTAVNLAKNVRELMLKSPFANLKALNGTSHQPPVDSRGSSLDDFDNWKQTIKVQAVDPDRLTLDVNDATPAALRITIGIDHNNEHVCDVSWYSFDGTP